MIGGVTLNIAAFVSTCDFVQLMSHKNAQAVKCGRRKMHSMIAVIGLSFIFIIYSLTPLYP